MMKETQTATTLAATPKADPESTRPPIKLEPSEAWEWLNYLDADACPIVKQCEELLRFRDQLSDALWMASWQRDYAQVPRPSADELGEIAAAIASCSELCQTETQLSVLEQMAECLLTRNEPA